MQTKVLSSAPRLLILLLFLSLAGNAILLPLLLRSHTATSSYTSLARAEELSASDVAALKAGSPPTLGREDAPVNLVLFSDFECPYCRKLAAELRGLDPRLMQDVRITFRQFPLSFHRNAYDYAEVTACAAQQSNQAFWELFDYMYKQDDLKGEAAEAAVNLLKQRKDVSIEKLLRCFRERKSVRSIEHDIALGNVYGVQGTPTMFINGERLVGSQPSLGLILRRLRR